MVEIKVKASRQEKGKDKGNGREKAKGSRNEKG
jgi:hypothetical protein